MHGVDCGLSIEEVTIARHIRFCLSKAQADSAEGWETHARNAEAAGYDVLHVPDHLGALSPAVAMQAAAAVTERIRVGTLVINNDFRNPLLLAQEAASVDLLSGGRLELGLGAGWNQPEYDAAGISFDGAADRIARLEESVTVLRRLFAGETVSHNGEHYSITDYRLTPEPPQGAGLPILIGGNGDRLLAVAARNADIIGFTGFTIRPAGPVPGHFTREGLADRIAHVRREAGARFSELELNVLVQWAVVTDDPQGRINAIAAEWRADGDETLSLGDIAEGPFVLLGSVDSIVAEIQQLHDDLGIGSITVFASRSEGFDDVVRAFS